MLHGANTELTVSNFMGFVVDGYAVASVHTGTLKIKLNKQGQLVKATWKTLAGTLDQSVIPTNDPDTSFAKDRFWGSMSITGQTVPIAKLPFEVLP